MRVWEKDMTPDLFFVLKQQLFMFAGEQHEITRVLHKQEGERCFLTHDRFPREWTRARLTCVNVHLQLYTDGNRTQYYTDMGEQDPILHRYGGVGLKNPSAQTSADSPTSHLEILFKAF